MASPFVLIVAILTVESSYAQNLERPVETVPDTVQFWFTPTQQWRVKTFAIDHDIHVHSIGSGSEGQSLTVQFAEANIRKTYGDVLAELHVIEFSDATDKAEVESTFARLKLRGTLEIGKSGVAFYNPDGGRYSSQSRPE